MKRITKEFFTLTPTNKLGKELLGKELVHETPQGIMSGIINEVEIYIENDEASHSYNGRKTPRNEPMFYSGGHSYVYFTYGMHHCFNITSGLQNQGEAVLIRSILPKKGIELMKINRNYTKTNLKDLTNGPAKLCQALQISKQQNKLDITHSDSKLYLRETNLVPKEILTSPRVGLSKNKDKLWNFKIKELIKKE